MTARLVIFILSAFVGLAASTAQATTLQINIQATKEASQEVYDALGIVRGQGLVIIEPDIVTAPNASNWIWLLVESTSSGANLMNAAFAYGAGRPTSGGNACWDLTGDGGDTIFQNGFEAMTPLINNGIIAMSTWLNVPVGSPDWQTNTNVVFGSLTTPGTRRCETEFVTPEGVTSATFTFEIQ